MSLKILHYPEPVLLTAAKPLGEEDFTPDLARFADEMFAAMSDARGVGLAAPQVGVSQRIFVMDIPEDDDGPREKHVLVNPEIIRVEGEQVSEEGCLSFPGLFQPVKREMRVIARAFDVRRQEFEIEATGLAARCILHESDHLDGIVFLDRMSPLKRELSKRKIRALQKQGKWE